MIPARRHVPLRTCVICGQKASKREFTRIVSTPDGGVEIDQMGKLSGRGAYICSDIQCGAGPVKRGRVEHALRGPITDGDWEKVVTVIETRSNTAS